MPVYDHKFFAPFWADFDITGTGDIYYRQTSDLDLLDRATREINNAFSVSEEFSITSLFIATWDAVGYYPQGTDKVMMLPRYLCDRHKACKLLQMMVTHIVHVKQLKNINPCGLVKLKKLFY